MDYAPQGFRVLPPVVKNLLIINVICFLGTMVMQKYGLGNYINLLQLNNLRYNGVLYGTQPLHFYIWQPITYMFLHGNFEHLFFNMFALWMFGNTLENIWGARRFLFYYLFCGVGAAICNLLIPGWPVCVGASGAVYGLLLAFGMIFPNERIYLYFIMPIKAKWFVIGYAVLELIEGVLVTDGIAHFAHLGGMLFGFLLLMYWRKHPFSRY